MVFAQLVAQLTVKLRIPGSSPVSGIFFPVYKLLWRVCWRMRAPEARLYATCESAEGAIVCDTPYVPYIQAQ